LQDLEEMEDPINKKVLSRNPSFGEGAFPVSRSLDNMFRRHLRSQSWFISKILYENILKKV